MRTEMTLNQHQLYSGTLTKPSKKKLKLVFQDTDTHSCSVLNTSNKILRILTENFTGTYYYDGLLFTE
jgi:hypothetical protein